ncbi:MAG TPA: zinc ribbon domain-containing protein, partial [Blastocatellia bacterium]|nr:zinc ribbon domain-containing protein [Blastocatellia bacterium]
MITCPKCEAENRPTAASCRMCATPLETPARSVGAQTERPSLPPTVVFPDQNPQEETMESSEPEGVACPTCHTMNEAGWAFCQQCGSKLPQPASPPPIEPPRPMEPQTVVAQPVRDSGPGMGKPMDQPPPEPPYPMGQPTVPNQPIVPPRPPQPPADAPPQLGRPTVVSEPAPREAGLSGGQPPPANQPPAQRFNAPPGMGTESVQSMPKGMGGIPCQQCGHLNNMGSAFCAACGTPIPVAKTIVMS